MPQLPLTIDVKDPKSAMAAVMQMTLKHTADVLTAAVCAIAEKYGIDEEEMMEVVRSHPRFTEMTVEPMIHDLMPAAVAEEPAPAVPAEVIVVEDVEPVAVAAAPVPVKKRGGPKKLSEMTPEERAAHDAKVAARKAKLAAEAAAAVPVAPLTVAAEPAPVEPVPEPVAEPAPVRKVFKIKPKAAKTPEA